MIILAETLWSQQRQKDYFTYTRLQMSYIQLNLPSNSAVIDCAYMLCMNAFGRKLYDQSCSFPNGSSPIAHLKYFQ